MAMEKTHMTIKASSGLATYYVNINNGNLYYYRLKYHKASEETAAKPKFYTVTVGGTYYGQSEAKLTYTSATVGGVTTGGLDYQPSKLYSQKVHSDKARIHMDIGSEKDITVTQVTFSKDLAKRLNNISKYKDFINEDTVACVTGTDLPASALQSLRAGNRADFMNTVSSWESRQSFDTEYCNAVTEMLNIACKGFMLMSDDELYSQACNWAQSAASNKVNDAIEAFEMISYYKDSAELLAKAKSRYDEVLQEEQKNALKNQLSKEISEKKQKKEKIKGLFAESRKKTLQEEIDELETRLNNL